MKNLIATLLVASFVLFISCGEKFDELKNAAEVIKNAPEAIEKMSESVDLGQKKLDERRAKGDTLALHFNVLTEYIPKSIPGFKAGEPNGQTTNAAGFSMSSVECDYTAEDGSGRKVKITLMDYNESYAMFSGVAYWMNLGLSTETSDGFQRSFKSDNKDIAGFEEYSKKSKNAKLTYAIGYRFLLNIEENEATSIDYIKSVAQKIDMNKLSKL